MLSFDLKNPPKADIEMTYNVHFQRETKTNELGNENYHPLTLGLADGFMYFKDEGGSLVTYYDLSNDRIVEYVLKRFSIQLCPLLVGLLIVQKNV